MHAPAAFSRAFLSLPAIEFLLLALAPLSRIPAAEPWKRHTIDDSSRGADGVRLADVNADGRLDVTTGWEEGGVIRVYINPGPAAARKRWPAVTVGRVASPEDAVFVDLDGDGAHDVVSSAEGSERTIHVHWAPGEERYLDAAAWKTEAFPATRQRQSWMFALPMQADGSGGVDLIVGSKGRGATVGWLQSPEEPRDLAAWKFRALREAGWIMSLQSHDMDGDGDGDVLVSDRRGPRAGVVWLENPGAANAAAGAAWTEHVVAVGVGEVMFLATGDLDADGRLDIVAAVRKGGLIYLRATGDPRAPWRRHTIDLPAGCGTEKAVAVCDVNLDGKNDLIFTCEDAAAGRSGVRWLSYSKSPIERRWQDHEISGAPGIKFDRLEVLDLDADGDLDVLSCEERDNLGVFWYENPLRPRSKSAVQSATIPSRPE